MIWNVQNNGEIKLNSASFCVFFFPLFVRNCGTNQFGNENASFCAWTIKKRIYEDKRTWLKQNLIWLIHFSLQNWQHLYKLVKNKINAKVHSKDILLLWPHDQIHSQLISAVFPLFINLFVQIAISPIRLMYSSSVCKEMPKWRKKWHLFGALSRHIIPYFIHHMSNVITFLNRRLEWILSFLWITNISFVIAQLFHSYLSFLSYCFSSCDPVNLRSFSSSLTNDIGIYSQLCKVATTDQTISDVKPLSYESVRRR